MNNRKKTLIFNIAVPLIVGGASAVLTGGKMKDFEKVNQPPLSPPAWLFPIVWTILFTLMGIASWRVLESDNDPDKIHSALRIYTIQLAVNFFWPIFFFQFDWYLFSFFWLCLLWILILITLIRFYRLDRTAGWLMLPYLIWVTFAGYLNLMIAILN